MANDRPPIPVSPAQANNVSDELRNSIYSHLLSGTGIRNIEATLTHELQRSGFLDNLTQYVTQLVRSGEATTVPEIMAKVREKMDLTRAPFTGQSNSSSETATTTTATTNGAVNGVNGASALNGTNGDIDLRIPTRAITQGVKTVREELDKVCDITYSEDE